MIPREDGPPGPYAIGSGHLPGLSKLIEEAGEVLQVAGKILGAGGVGAHWDGGADLDVRLAMELADLQAAIDFFLGENPRVADAALPVREVKEGEGISERRARKLRRFQEWHQEQGPDARRRRQEKRREEAEYREAMRIQCGGEP